MKTKKCGSSSVETLVSFCLLSLFIGFIFILTFHTSKAYQNLSDENIALSQMRIASSYIRTIMRQNNGHNPLYIAEHHTLKNPALVIEENVFGRKFETWIYLENGLLKEVTIPEDHCLSDGQGLNIATLESIDFHLISPKHLEVTLQHAEEHQRILQIHTVSPIQRIER